MNRHFKYFRLGALYRALTLLNASPSAHRVLPSSLTLGAILIYMLNALNYRPAEGQREEDLTHTCCWNDYSDNNIIDLDEDQVEPTPVMLLYGLYFISGVYLQGGTTFRMGGGNTVSSESIERLYGVLHERDLNVAFRIKSISERTNNRTQNRRQEPRDVRRVAPRAELVAQDTPLANRGITMKPLPREHGEDIRAFFRNRAGDDEDHERDQEGIDDVVTRIWRQFPYDLFENAPNQRFSYQGSYLRLSVQQRQDATIEVFQTTDLRDLFSRVVVKVVKPDKWRDLEFRRYFPTKDFVPPKKLQNFPRMRYYQEWNTLMDSLSSKEAEIVRKSFWKTFKTFKWLPLTDADRLWCTKVVKPTAEWFHLPHNDKEPVVRIGLNGELVRNPRSVRLYKKPEIVEVVADDGSNNDRTEIVEISSD